MTDEAEGNARQAPLGTRFGPGSTTGEVLEGIGLTGRTALVTGGYSGLGLEVAKSLVAAGARVVVPARRVDAARAALEGMGAHASVVPMNLADLASVAEGAKAVRDAVDRLDLAILAAGIMAMPETRVGDGWESQFAVNHLGHFALIQHLWDLFDEGARIVVASSGAHAITGMRWDDLHFARGYDKWQAYGQSKCANALFAVELDLRGQPKGVRAFAAHPGLILTPLQRHLPKEEMVAAGWIDVEGRLVDPGFKTPAQGAATFVWAATSPALAGLGGVYCEDCDVAAVKADDGGEAGVAPHAIDPAEARRLWHESEEMTGTRVIA